MTTPTPAPIRFWSKVSGSDATSCWEWTGAKVEKGYGLFTISDGNSIRAHRFAYLQMIGEIPDGLVLDHLCRNRGCVNPWHLEPVTVAINNRRGLADRIPGWTLRSATRPADRICRAAYKRSLRQMQTSRRLGG